MSGAVRHERQFGVLLRELRQAAGLSREALAERAGLSADAVSTLERGVRRTPRLATVVSLADALRIEPGVRADLMRAAGHFANGPAADPPVLATRQLPVPPTILIGRDEEVAFACRLLAPGASETRLVTLLGTGGVGKTRLALEIAAHVADQYRDGVVLVDLAPLSDARVVPATIARAVGIHEVAARSAQELLSAELAQRQLLLVLDNFEHLLAAAPLIADLLAKCAELNVLVTSRSALRVRAEHRFMVDPLAAADPSQPFDAIAAAPAVQLFVERATATAPEFALTERNSSDVARICQYLDGLPLAIELAAVRAGVLDPQALLHRLERRVQSLTAGATDLPERQRTLRNTLAWSYGLLESGQRTLLARLSVFVDGCSLQAAHAVCAVDSTLDLVDQLVGLVDNSLVLQSTEPEPRIRLLDTIREYASEQLAQSGELDPLRRRHAAYFLTWAEAGARQADGPDAAAWFAALEQERANLRAALDCLAECGASVDALRLAHAIAPFWTQRGPVHEARARLAALLALPGTHGKSARAVALLDAALLAWAQADYASEQQLAEAAVAAYRAAGDLDGYAQALADLAAANCNAGVYSVARELAQQVLATNPDHNLRLYWRALMVFASSARDEADFGTATRYYHEILEHARQAGDGYWMGHVLSCLGWTMLYAGDADRARTLHEEGLALRQAIGHPREIAVSLTALGHVALASENREEARSLYHQSIGMHREVGNRWGIAMVLEGCAAATAAEEPVRALRLGGAADRLRSVIRRPMPAAEQPIHSRWLEPARQSLDPEAAVAAWSDGAAMDLGAALADVEVLLRET